MGYLDNAGLERLWSKIRSALSRKQDAASAFTQTQADERYLKLSGGRVTGELTLPGDYAEAIKFREGGEEGYAYIGTSNDADGSNYSIHIGKYYGGLHESIVVRGIETPEGPNDYIGSCAASKKYVDEAVAAGGGAPYYATCSTASNTAAKAAVCNGFLLGNGVMVAVKFTNSNTALSPTLNVNGTGAKYIKKYGTTGNMANMWAPGAIVLFVYDGTNWVMENGTTATLNYYGLTKLSDSISDYSTSTAATSNAVRMVNEKAEGAMSLAENHLHQANDVIVSTVKTQNHVLDGNFSEWEMGSPISWQNDGRLNYSFDQQMAYITYGDDFGYVSQSKETDSQHQYYFRLDATCGDAVSEADVIISLNPEKPFTQRIRLHNTEIAPISCILAGGGDTLSIGIQNYDYTYILHAMLIDLTEMFGAGNEPTKDDCDMFVTFGETTCVCKISVDVVLRKIAQELNSSRSIPEGTIILWSDGANTIPDGWALCDGSNGTPDLRERFEQGTEGAYTLLYIMRMGKR